MYVHTTLSFLVIMRWQVQTVINNPIISYQQNTNIDHFNSMIDCMKMRLKSSTCKVGKGKVVPVLLTEHHAMKAYWGVEV
jgi:hypothetical protein